MANRIPISHETYRDHYLRQLSTAQEEDLAKQRESDTVIEFLLETAALMRQIAPSPLTVEMEADPQVTIFDIETLQEALFGGYADQQQVEKVARAILTYPHIYEKLWIKSAQLGGMAGAQGSEKAPAGEFIVETLPHRNYATIAKADRSGRHIFSLIAAVFLIFCFIGIWLSQRTEPRPDEKNFLEWPEMYSTQLMGSESGNTLPERFYNLLHIARSEFNRKEYEQAILDFEKAAQLAKQMAELGLEPVSNDSWSRYHFHFGLSQMAVAYREAQTSPERDQLLASAINNFQQALEKGRGLLRNREKQEIQYYLGISRHMREKSVKTPSKGDSQLTVQPDSALYHQTPQSPNTHFSPEESTMGMWLLLVELFQVFLLIVLIKVVWDTRWKGPGRGDGESDMADKEDPDTGGGQGGGQGGQGGD